MVLALLSISISKLCNDRQGSYHSLPRRDPQGVEWCGRWRCRTLESSKEAAWLERVQDPVELLYVLVQTSSLRFHSCRVRILRRATSGPGTKQSTTSWSLLTWHVPCISRQEGKVLSLKEIIFGDWVVLGIFTSTTGIDTRYLNGSSHSESGMTHEVGAKTAGCKTIAPWYSTYVACRIPDSDASQILSLTSSAKSTWDSNVGKDPSLPEVPESCHK